VDDQGWRRLRGLKRLIHDGVRQGADFVEKHHRHAAEKPFRVLESIPPIAAPTKVVHGIHDGVLWLSYGGIRAINQAIEVADDWLVDRLAPADDDHPPDHDTSPET
jgi:hypothetical protein